jgi:trigger factor
LLVPKESDVIEKGDTVIFDFKGFIEDKPLEGGEAKLFELEIGSNQFIPGFEEQMIGLKKNTEQTINVVFPKDYHVANLANKQARFDLNIRDIKVSQKPNIDEQYIATLKLDGVHSKQDLEKHIEKQIENEHRLSDRQINMSLIYEYIRKHSKLSYLPNFIVTKEVEHIKTTLSNQAQQNQLTLEQFMNNKYQVKDSKDIPNKLEELAKDNVILIYSLSKIIGELNIKITDSDREQYYQEISNIYNLPINEIKKMINQNQNIGEVILQNKLVDEIIKLNK